MAGKHAVFSASGAHTWAHCLGSLAMCQRLPESAPTRYAAEGTVYHEIAAEILREGRHDVTHYLGQEREADGFKFIVTLENLEHVMTYVNAVRSSKGSRLYEVELDTSVVVGIPGQFGTGDCVSWVNEQFNPESMEFDGTKISVDDLKFGVGECVDAFAEPGPDKPRWMGLNVQLMIYLCAAYRSVEADGRKVVLGRIGIHQPRFGRGHFDDAYVSVGEMEEFIAWITERAQKANALLTAPREEVLRNLTPSDSACRWCRIKNDCPGRMKQAAAEFDDVSAAAGTAEISDQQLGETLIKLESLANKLKDFKAEATRRAENGRTVPGWRLSEPKLGDREWTDAAKVEDALLHWVQDGKPVDPYKKELVSPTEAERRFKSKAPLLWAKLNGNPDKKTKNPTTDTYIARKLGSRYLVRDFGDAPPVTTSAIEFEMVSPIAEFL